MIRYRLRVSKEALTFGQVLESTIQRWYESDSDFARHAKVSSSAVSRWVAGIQVPRPDTIEKMAPWIKDDRGRPIPAASLLAVAYPALAKPATAPAAATPMHRLARDVDRLLAEDSPLPADKRANLESLMEMLIDPYRPYLRRRRAS